MIDELHENLKNEESKRMKVNQINTKLQHQVTELTDVSMIFLLYLGVYYALHDLLTIKSSYSFSLNFNSCCY